MRSLTSAVLGWLVFVGSGHAAGYELLIKNIVVKSTTATGGSWDPFGGSPDPYVLVKVQKANETKSKEVFRTPTKNDTLKAEWDAVGVNLDLGDKVTLEVWDGDVDPDDHIGTYNFTVDQQLLDNGDLSLSFQQVEKLRIILEAPSLKKSELETRVEAIRKMAFAEKRVRPIDPPWTQDRIKEFFKQNDDSLKDLLEGKRPITMDRIITHRLMDFATTRLKLSVEDPRRKDAEEMMTWIDSWIAHDQIIYIELAHAIEVTTRYVAYKKTNHLRMNRAEDKALIAKLVELENNLRERVTLSPIITLMGEFTRKPSDQDKAAIEKRIAALRLTLPEKYRTADAKELKKYGDELIDQLGTTAFFAHREALDHHLDLITERLRVIPQKEKLVPDRGKIGEERRDLERLRAHSIAMISAQTEGVMRWNLNLLELCALRNHADRQYSGKADRLGDQFVLPKAHDHHTKHYEKQAPEIATRLRKSLEAIQKEVNEDDSFFMGVADWLLIKGPDVATVFMDAAIDDLTKSMKDLPTLRRTVKEQVMSAAGFPSGKTSLADLSAEETDVVRREMVKTYKEIRAGFNRDTLYRMRQDLDLLEVLLRDYPPKGLISVAKPSWNAEPKDRLLLEHCRNLNKAEAARAYQRLFTQLHDDLDRVHDETARYWIKINLKVTYHIRATAK